MLVISSEELRSIVLAIILDMLFYEKSLLQTQTPLNTRHLIGGMCHQIFFHSSVVFELFGLCDWVIDARCCHMKI